MVDKAEVDDGKLNLPSKRLSLRSLQGTGFNNSIQQLLGTPVSPRPVSFYSVSSPSGGINTAPAIKPQFSGLPQPVSDVRVSRVLTANGVTATVRYTRNAADPYFERVNVWVRNYKGNQEPILLASSQSSPVKVSLENTGEHVTFYIQASSKAGSAQLFTSPTASLSLR